jgi:glycosyltransferase involved in cell wall biosynthesis
VKVVFIHHHLRQGGVTRVIEEQIDAVRDDHDVLVITGEPPPSKKKFPVEIIPSLSYDRDRHERTGAGETATAVLNRVESVWGKGADLFHVHNPTLGKNRDFIGVLKELQRKGGRLLLQIHDFAEDGRPQNYTGESYPSNCHYAAINSRDYNILLRAGLHVKGLHLIPNAVRELLVSREVDEHNLILYPVRAIRRKNIGEALFLSLFISGKKRIAVTLEPTGELDVASYRSWMAFAEREQLPVLFGVGMKQRFEELLAESRCVLTTSIKEGFGLAFLESWMGSRPLVGRILPDICADFIEKGLELGHLYTKLAVPLSLFDYNGFCERWEHCYRQRLECYGLGIEETVIRDYLQQIRVRGEVDFGELNEDMQMQVIMAVKNSGANRNTLVDMNPFLSGGCDSGDWHDLVERNRKIVSREYSVQKNRERILNMYRKVLAFTPRHHINVDKLLHIFSTPESNHLLLCDQAYGI